MAVDIDDDVGRWILEFLFRQSLDDNLLNCLIRILPFTSNNPSLNKSLILRKLESEISKQSISETLLDLLQQIEELDLQAGITEHSESIKAAFLAVAVECTVKFLGNSEEDGRIEYVDAVKRIWKGRVRNLEKAEGVELILDALKSWKDDIEAAVWEDSARDILLKRSEEINAIEAVRVYVKEEKGKLGHSFIESVAEALKVDEELMRVLLGNHDQTKDKEMKLQGDNQNAGPSHEKREMHKDNVLSRRKQTAGNRIKGVLAGKNRGAKIVDVDTSYEDEPSKTCELPTTLEVNKVLEALELSSFKRQATVKGPPPDSLCIAENAVSNMIRKNISSESIEERNTRADPPVARGSQQTQDHRDNMANHSIIPQNNGTSTSLVVWKPTAPIFERDDSKDDPLLDSHKEGIQKRKVASPPKVYEQHKVSKQRRIARRWSVLEEETLRVAIEEFGKGNWKLILNAYRSIFEDRTEVDLKDKWRNLMRC